MRRGLMRRDEDELPKRTLSERCSRLQAAMRRDRLDALLIYTNLVRPSAVCWLTGFTPYWIDSLLLVPQGGVPILATALSKRVAEWVRSTSWVEEIINTPRPGAAIGERLAAAGSRRVGVLELDALPAGLYDDLVAAAPAVELSDAGSTFSDCRRPIDDTERRLIARADALALAALAQAELAEAKDAGVLAGLAEKHARLNAAEEAYIAVAPDLDTDRRLIHVSREMPLGRRFALRAAIAYKGSWVRRTRTFARDAAGARAFARGETWLSGLVSSVRANEPLAAQLAAALETLPRAELANGMAESSVGSYPLEVVASSGAAAGDVLPDGAFAVLSIELAIDGVPWLGAAPVLVGSSP